MIATQVDDQMITRPPYSDQTRGRAMAEQGYEVHLFGIAPIVLEVVE